MRARRAREHRARALRALRDGRGRLWRVQRHRSGLRRRPRGAKMGPPRPLVAHGQALLRGQSGDRRRVRHRPRHGAPRVPWGARHGHRRVGRDDARAPRAGRAARARVARRHARGGRGLRARGAGPVRGRHRVVVRSHEHDRISERSRQRPGASSRRVAPARCTCWRRRTAAAEPCGSSRHFSVSAEVAVTTSAFEGTGSRTGLRTAARFYEAHFRAGFSLAVHRRLDAAMALTSGGRFFVLDLQRRHAGRV